MKERPILFSGPMVRAILEGQKTQTRRVMKPQPAYRENESISGHFGTWFHNWNLDHSACTIDDIIKYCPYGQPRDRLWVRETWGVGCRPCPRNGWRDGIEYRADEAYLEDSDDLTLYEPEGAPDDFYADYNKTGWRPSIHMPRWICRLLLDVKAVRVERLNDISEDDCKAEGCIDRGDSAGDEFAKLWESINGKRGFGWKENPCVLVIEFKKVASDL